MYCQNSALFMCLVALHIVLKEVILKVWSPRRPRQNPEFFKCIFFLVLYSKFTKKIGKGVKLLVDSVYALSSILILMLKWETEKIWFYIFISL